MVPLASQPRQQASSQGGFSAISPAPALLSIDDEASPLDVAILFCPQALLALFAALSQPERRATNPIGDDH